MCWSGSWRPCWPKGFGGVTGVCVEDRVRASLAYMAGLSYRDVAYILGLVQTSHVAVWTWVQRLKMLVFRVEPRFRRAVAVDETVLKMGGRRLYAWAAVDVDSREVLAIGASLQRMDLDTYAFLRRVLKACRNKPLFLVDRGPWYPPALNRLGLRSRHATFGLRNRVERWFGTLKAGTRRFTNAFPVKKPGGALERIELWLQLFSTWYNRIGLHQALGRLSSRR